MTYGTVNADLITTSDGVSSAGVYGFKNRIFNSQMQIAQRATSATITAGSTIAAGYSTVDRFYVYCTGANVTAAQVAGSGATKNRLQITGAASVTAIGVGQRIESLNSYDLASSVATLSVDLANSLLTTVTWTAYYANTADTFGTLASPTRTQISTGTFTVNSTVTRYNAQITIPAAATRGIEIVFTVGAQISGTWTIGNVQLEEGSTATSFDYRSYGTELNLCQRYYYKHQGTTGTRFSISFNSTTTNAAGWVPFIVPMRIAPTALEQTGTAGDYSVAYLNTGATCTSVPTFNNADTLGSTVSFITSAVLTAGQGSQMYSGNNNGYLAWSAEL